MNLKDNVETAIRRLVPTLSFGVMPVKKIIKMVKIRYAFQDKRGDSGD
jgi:hypothetical protein